MKVTRIVLSLCFLLTLTGSALAQKVNVDWDKSANFTGFKTYAWAKGTPPNNPLMAERVVRDIDAQLAAKGLQKVDASSNPDLVVAYHAAVSEETQLNTMDTGMWGPGWGYGWGGGGMSTTTVSKIPVGQLVVDIGDVKTKKFLWRGTASGTLSDKPEKVEKTINKAVKKMFEKFPPPVKK
ncbi:MAG: DUF4136 domain-containing protein [Acidobacteria bacterium]|nr:DUF4136 domain-containing protein [Acidobacteriota bacterium]